MMRTFNEFKKSFNENINGILSKSVSLLNKFSSKATEDFDKVFENPEVKEMFEPIKLKVNESILLKNDAGYLLLNKLDNLPLLKSCIFTLNASTMEGLESLKDAMKSGEIMVLIENRLYKKEDDISMMILHKGQNINFTEFKQSATGVIINKVIT